MTSIQHPSRSPESVELGERPKLIFFFSSTSGRSRRADGFLAQVLQRRGNHNTFELLRIDADERPDLAQRLGVRSAPELLVLDCGRVRGRLTEPRGCVQIEELLAPWLK
jgi:thioredoxin-like negative regulator of GroEL